jgi:hypothetical protein
MERELKIAQLNKEILKVKLTEPTNFLKIRKLQIKLDKLYEGRSSAT